MRIKSIIAIAMSCGFLYAGNGFAENYESSQRAGANSSKHSGKHDNGLRHHAHAVTLWWVIFNQPDNCTGNPGGAEQCTGADVFGQAYLDSLAANDPDPGLIAPNIDAGLAVVYATGGVTDRRNGRIRLVASIYRSDAPVMLTGDQVIDPMGLSTALHDTGAEIHLVVRDHGRARREGVITQITNFLEPYCSDPALLFEGGRNVCQDVQFAIFGPGEIGQDAVIRFADGQALSDSAAYMFRQGDAVQAVVETRIRDRRGKR